ncbi:unnamed protein product [Calypogeia fissa]
MAGYDIGKERDEARLNPRRKAMEDYGCRPEVHELLTRFITDLLTSEPPDPAAFMYMWSVKEQQRPRPRPPVSPGRK